jgi:hypothetical protein
MAMEQSDLSASCGAGSCQQGKGKTIQVEKQSQLQVRKVNLITDFFLKNLCLTLFIYFFFYCCARGTLWHLQKF